MINYNEIFDDDEPSPPPDDEPPQDHPSPSEKEEKISAATALVNLAIERYDLAVTPDGEPYATAKTGRGHIARFLRGGKQPLRAELAKLYYRDRSKAAPQQALTDALQALEGMAQEMEPVETHLRVARHDDAIWIDLGDVDENVIRLDPQGWRMVTDDDPVPVRFRRTKLTGALPIPENDGGDLDELWEFVNVDEADRPLILAWLVAAILTPAVPHCILTFFAEQGSAKSTATRALSMLIDLSPVPLRKPPRDVESWVTAAQGSWVVAVDNISTIPDWLSDALCRASTGDGDVRRALYTDGNLAIFAFRRCVLVNGIDVGALRGDLAERLLTVKLLRIDPDTRCKDGDLWAKWDALHPKLLGALLARVAGVARVLPSVELGRSPRMADFAEVLAAVDQVLETDGLTRYLEQSVVAALDSLDGDPFLMRMTAAIIKEFEGTAAELLAMVDPGDDKRKPPGWPKNAREVTTILHRNAPALRQAKWTIEDLGSRNKKKVTNWHINPPDPTS
ncbi:ATP-binding protein [Rhodococcus sp. ACPA1]|uniref:ATP-binding protein n=1 Tax=Rhodococcus sp. ACPA1 TaxID=2028572 RepID=UPI0015C88551|nr:ATP-binding protein [Rhodococcus sp. ACPA1]